MRQAKLKALGGDEFDNNEDKNDEKKSDSSSDSDSEKSDGE